MTETTDVGRRYDGVRQRLSRRLVELDTNGWQSPVAACPGWTVHDTLAHLVGIIEDAVAGRLSGPPDTDQTSEQVTRHRSTASAVLLSTWAEIGPVFAANIPTGAWPAFIDVLSHECDIRTSLGEAPPTADMHEDLSLAASLVSDPVDTDAGRVRFAVDGEGAPAGADEFMLAAPAFELLRARLGRRTRAEVEALSWSKDPAPVIDQIFIFGPATNSIREALAPPQRTSD